MGVPVIHYATLSQVRTYLKPGTTDMATDDDDTLRSLIMQAVRAIDEYTHRHFDPVSDTRAHDYPIPRRNTLGMYSARRWGHIRGPVSTLQNRILKLDDDLLSLTTLTNGDGDDFDPDDYVVEPANSTPKHSVRLLLSAASMWERSSGGNRAQVIDVEGIWGYHRRWSEAFVSTSDAVKNDPLAADGTSLEVTDIDGDAGDLEPNRIQAGNLLKIGTEYVYVTAITLATNAATIVRAFNGTTAAEHALGTTIYVFRPDWQVVLATEHLVKQYYRSMSTDETNIQRIVGTGIQIKPESLPKYVTDLLPAPRIRDRARHR